MGSRDQLSLNVYQKILFQDDKLSVYKTADAKRKCLAQMVNSSMDSLDNRNICHLTESVLDNYLHNVELHSENIYNKKLKEILKKQPNIKRDFKSNLENIDVKSLLKPLSCSNKNHCTTSETFSEGEFCELHELLKSQKLFHKPGTDAIRQEPRIENHLKLPATRDYRNIKRNHEVRYPASNSFKTARDELSIQNLKKYGNNSGTNQTQTQASGVSSCMGQKRKLGSRRNINSKFISPLLSNSESQGEIKSDEWTSTSDERLKNIEPKLVELIKSEIMDIGPNIHWNDVVGLEFAKTAIQEAVVWPMLRPDIFTGLRRPPKGILLFGPPGTGKTLIGKCVASQSKSTFFSISASSLTSKWVGEGEKMVRALFTVARVHQPAVIFIDEIDSLLSQRSDTEHESSRRMKTEFLVQLDGAMTDNEEKILVIGATNRPQELDEAARRRFVKRLYIPLPEFEARLQLVKKLIANERNQLNEDDFSKVAALSDGYSGADIRTLCSEASLGPIRTIDMSRIEHIQATEVRPLIMQDFEKAFMRVKASVSQKDLEHYLAYNQTYGSGSGF
ncbi:unnamed protein product [Callosobruchus maculatus]|uniref:Fidgetin-like protein 1 n=1 Tax=Callosobruchus maculatus TaxID=64391 RepID=A0A653CQ85_CALMS|nr:unnamed protein product [Callosobruchus maculatus]